MGAVDQAGSLPQDDEQQSHAQKKPGLCFYACLPAFQ